VGARLTTIERLERWKDSGVITEAQHGALVAIVRRDRVSLYVELHALLYVGVVSIVAGLGWTFRDYVVNLGDVAILSILGLLMAGSFGYCFTRGPGYTNDEVESSSFGFDYVLYFACLVLSATLAFIEARFALFHGWDTHLLIAALVFGALAYRFDNRFVLSLALSTLAGYLGLKISAFDTLDTDRLRFAGFLYGAFLIGVGVLLHQRRIKAHFLDVYLQLGANALLLAAISGVLEQDNGWAYLVVLVAFAATSIYLGVRYRRFAFVTYGTLYGYAGLSVRLLDAMGGVIIGLTYFIVTGSIVVILLVVLARRIGRDE
jgi:Predicted membrane protein (DUF2157)